MGEIKIPKNFAGSHSGRDTERPAPRAGSLSAFMLQKGSTGRGSKGYGQAYAAWYAQNRGASQRAMRPNSARGYQYNPPPAYGSQSRPTTPTVSTTSDPNQAYGMRSPAGARGLIDFQAAGSKIPSGPKHAAFLVGGLAAPLAVPVAAAGAGFVAAAPAVAAALGTAGAIGTKIVSNVSKVGTRVSSVLPATKASKLAADTAAKKTADRVAGAAARRKAAAAAAKKKAAAKKAAADKAQKGETAAAQNAAGALAQQDARMGGSGARR